MWLACFVVVAVAALEAHALIHHLEIRQDTRGKFFIENFGFDEFGTLKLNCSNIELDPMVDTLKPPAPDKLGFYITYSLTNSPRFIEEHDDPSQCLLNVKKSSIFEQIIPITSWYVLEEYTETNQMYCSGCCCSGCCCCCCCC
jgi:hypothetical protein